MRLDWADQGTTKRKIDKGPGSPGVALRSSYVLIGLPRGDTKVYCEGLDYICEDAAYHLSVFDCFCMTAME